MTAPLERQPVHTFSLESRARSRRRAGRYRGWGKYFPPATIVFRDRSDRLHACFFLNTPLLRAQAAWFTALYLSPIVVGALALWMMDWELLGVLLLSPTLLLFSAGMFVLSREQDVSGRGTSAQHPAIDNESRFIPPPFAPPRLLSGKKRRGRPWYKTFYGCGIYRDYTEYASRLPLRGARARRVRRNAVLLRVQTDRPFGNRFLLWGQPDDVERLCGLLRSSDTAATNQKNVQARLKER